MIDISYDIHRLKVCEWAYYFERKAKEEKVLNDLRFEISNRQTFNINLLKEERHRSYGNKYVKRK